MADKVVPCRFRSADIRNAFDALSPEFEGAGQRAERIVVGGAALVLLFQARETTKDVDALFILPEAARIREAATRVAAQLDLPADWLDDASKGYIVGFTTGELLYESPWLIVRAASLPQLLAMKLAAWRDALDRDDARLLLSRMSGSADDVWGVVKPFVSTHQKPCMHSRICGRHSMDLRELVRAILSGDHRVRRAVRSVPRAHQPFLRRNLIASSDFLDVR